MGKKEGHKKSRSRSSSCSSSCSSESSEEHCSEEYLKKMYSQLKKKLIQDKSLMVAGSDAYGSFYSLNTQQINPSEPVKFEYSQAARNIDLNSSGQVIYVRRDGLYTISFHVAADGASQWTLFINNIPKYDRVFGTYNSAGLTIFMYIIPLRRDDVVTMRNFQSVSSVVTISQIIGGIDPGANCEIVFSKIAPYPEKNNEHYYKSKCENESDKKEHKLKKHFETFKKWMKYDPSLMPYGCEAYGSFYTLITQDVPVDSSVTYENHQNLLNMTHTLGSGDVTVQKDGIYLLVFAGTTTQACQFTIFVNGIPNQTTTAGINKGANVLHLRQELELKAGDVVSVKNHVSATGTITISNNAGGISSGLNAQLIIYKMGVPTSLADNCEVENACELEKDCLYKHFKHYLLEDCKLLLQGRNVYYYLSSSILQSINVEDPVIFNLLGNNKNIYFKTGATTITVLEDGIYELIFSLQAKVPSQFTIYVNNLPENSCIAGTDSGSGQLSVRQLLQLHKGDVLSVKNHTSFLNPVYTSMNPGGNLGGNNVYFLGEKLANIPKPPKPCPPKPCPNPPPTQPDKDKSGSKSKSN